MKKPVEGSALLGQGVGAALVVQLQLGLLVYCDVVFKGKVLRGPPSIQPKVMVFVICQSSCYQPMPVAVLGLEEVQQPGVVHLLWLF